MYVTPYLLKEKIKDPFVGRVLKFELDQRYYFYGDHFKNGWEKKDSFLKCLKRKINFCRHAVYVLKDHFFKGEIPPNTVVSTAYLSASKKISLNAINTASAPWDVKLGSPCYFNYKTYSLCKKFEEELRAASVNELISEDFIRKIYEIKKVLTDFYSQTNIVAGLFANDVGFFEVASIAVLKELHKKSFVYIHGLPGYYEKGTYDLADYTLVYGEAIKQKFIATGLSSQQVLTVGHPRIKSKETQIRSSLDNVLVLGSSQPGGQIKFDQITFWDRGNIILYCHQIQDLLKKQGVKQVTLRPHPGENTDWYKQHIDVEFFKIDTQTSLDQALAQSSLVIGPSSTVVLEALSAGVNYIVFEPFGHKKPHDERYELVPPFDGSDQRLVVAKSVAELNQCLSENRKSSSALLSDYAQTEFNLEAVVASHV